MSETRGRHGAQPGDLLLRPVALGALALLVVNDHLLKAAYPGPLTGKLSDVAGMVFFPILLAAGWELGQAAVRRWRGPSAGAAVIAIAASGLAFVLVKTTTQGAEAFGWAIGLAQWLLVLPVRLLGDGGVPAPAAARIVADPTDLLALPALAIALAIGLRRAGRQSAPSTAASLREVPA
jgi:hypothetical protein